MAGRRRLVLLTLLVLCWACQVLGGKSALRSTKIKSTKATSSQNITSKFCQKFLAECYKVALEGKTGNIQVVHQCQRNGGKTSSSYTFGCKADKVDKTKTVLKRLGSSKTITVSVSTQTAITKGISKQGPSTQTITAVDSTVTDTLAVETVTSAIFDNEEVPVLNVAIFPSLAKRSKYVDNSTFCSAFTSSCKSQCVRVKSKSKYTLCKANKANSYSLTCKCANGKILTQHALYQAANQANKKVVSTIATKTTDFPKAPTGAPTKFVTERVTSTVQVTATSTTQIVLAATGALEMRGSDGSSLGYVYTPDESQLLYSYIEDKSNAIEFMAVQDSDSGLYQLQTTDGSGNVFIVESGDSGSDYANNDGSYSWTYSGPPSVCGSAGFTAGTPDGAGYYSQNPCETFTFGKDVDSETISNRQTVDLSMQWYNPNDFFPNQYSWIVIDGFNFLLSAANPDVFARSYVSNQVVSLRFPA